MGNKRRFAFKWFFILCLIKRMKNLKLKETTFKLKVNKGRM